MYKFFFLFFVFLFFKSYSHNKNVIITKQNKVAIRQISKKDSLKIIYYLKNNLKNEEEYRFNHLLLSREVIIRRILDTNFTNSLLSLQFLEQLIESPVFKKDEILIAHLHAICSHYYSDLYDDVAFKKHSSIALEIYLKKKATYNFEIAHLYGLIAYNYVLDNNYAQAIDYYSKIIDMAKSSSNKILKHFSIAQKINLLKIYIKDEKFDIARVYLDEIKEFYTINKPILIRNIDMGFPLLYTSFYVDSYQEKIATINKGISLIRIGYRKGDLVEALDFRAQFFILHNLFKPARLDLQESISISKKNNFYDSLYREYMLLAQIQLKERNTQLALKYIDSTSNCKTNTIHQKKERALLLFKTYTVIKNYRKANFFAAKYIQFQDSILKDDKNYLTVSFGKKYQTEKKTQENILLNKENKIAFLSLKEERNKRYLLSTLSVIGLLFLFIIYYRYRTKKNLSNLLLNKNVIISQQNIKLENANKAKQKIISIIAHDLVNPFNALLGYTKLLYEEYDSFTKKEITTFIQYIHASATQNFKLAKSLLDWAKTQQNTILVQKEVINCKKIINLSYQPYLVFSKQKKISVTIKVENNISCIADKNMLVSCIGNVINNAIKFTPEGGFIIINTTIDTLTNTVSIIVKDTGVGIKNNIVETLQHLKSNPGTNNEKGTGFGLLITKEFMELQKGTLHFANNKPKGTIVTLKLPSATLNTSIMV